jgi:hypothetical protein
MHPIIPGESIAPQSEQLGEVARNERKTPSVCPLIDRRLRVIAELEAEAQRRRNEADACAKP